MFKSLLLILNIVFGLYPIVTEVTLYPMATISKYDYTVKEIYGSQTYPSCRDEIVQYVRENINFPQKAFHTTLRRRLYFNITIGPNGKLTECTPAFNETDSLATACAECLLSYEGWIPSKRKGKPVKTQSLVAISFSSSFNDPYQSVPDEELKVQVPDSLQEVLATDYYKLGWNNLPDTIIQKRNAIVIYNKGKRFFERSLALGNFQSLQGMAEIENRIGNTHTADSLLAQYNKFLIDSTLAFAPCTAPEVSPQYRGGIQELFNFLSSNISYPTFALEKRISGKVLISFVVDTNGSVTQLQILKSVHPSLDAEAMRVISKTTNWIPGSQNGKLVKVRYVAPILFRF